MRSSWRSRRAAVVRVFPHPSHLPCSEVEASEVFAHEIAPARASTWQLLLSSGSFLVSTAVFLSRLAAGRQLSKLLHTYPTKTTCCVRIPTYDNVFYRQLDYWSELMHR